MLALRSYKECVQMGFRTYAIGGSFLLAMFGASTQSWALGGASPAQEASLRAAKNSAVIYTLTQIDTAIVQAIGKLNESADVQVDLREIEPQLKQIHKLEKQLGKNDVVQVLKAQLASQKQEEVVEVDNDYVDCSGAQCRLCSLSAPSMTAPTWRGLDCKECGDCGTCWNGANSNYSYTYRFQKGVRYFCCNRSDELTHEDRCCGFVFCGGALCYTVESLLCELKWDCSTASCTSCKQTSPCSVSLCQVGCPISKKTPRQPLKFWLESIRKDYGWIKENFETVSRGEPIETERSPLRSGNAPVYGTLPTAPPHQEMRPSQDLRFDQNSVYQPGETL